MATQTDEETFWGGFVKILKEQQRVDVQLKACDSENGAAISAHKLFLSARSEVFKKMLESDKFKASSRVETTTLSELKHEELEALVEFIYSDGSVLTEKMKQHVRSLYIAADKYDIPHLRDLCRSQLESSLSHTNALDSLVIAQTPFDKSLNDAAITTIKSYRRTIASSYDEFKAFAVKHPSLTLEIMKAISKINCSCN